LTAVDHGDDVRMRELRDGAGLAPEALDVLLVLAVLGVEDLQRDVALEERVERAVDGRHPAGADDVLQLVATADQVLPHLHQPTVPAAAESRTSPARTRARLPTRPAP